MAIVVTMRVITGIWVLEDILLIKEIGSWIHLRHKTVTVRKALKEKSQPAHCPKRLLFMSRRERNSWSSLFGFCSLHCHFSAWEWMVFFCLKFLASPLLCGISLIFGFPKFSSSVGWKMKLMCYGSVYLEGFLWSLLNLSVNLYGMWPQVGVPFPWSSFVITVFIFSMINLDWRHFL